MKQKDVFLAGEGNAWHSRNAEALAKQHLPTHDSLLMELLRLESDFTGVSGTVRVLEVGCGSGVRLGWLQKHTGWECHGIEPSALAVKEAIRSGVQAQIGTADQLPFADNSIDVVIFGFCLYLCDRDDLFKIAAETDRVLKSPGWLLLKDFYSPEPATKEYHHRPGVYSYKMDYKRLFTWNPDYSIFSHRVTHHVGDVYTDDRQEWVETSVLRKYRLT